jgi:hypothetical protein
MMMAQGMPFFYVDHPVILFSDNTNALYSAGGSLNLARSIIDRDIARLEESI